MRRSGLSCGKKREKILNTMLSCQVITFINAPSIRILFVLCQYEHYDYVLSSKSSLFVLKDFLLFFIRIELRDDWRLENREAFANIWSDMVYGIVLFLLMCFNQSKVSISQNTVSFSFSIAYHNLCSTLAMHVDTWFSPYSK